MIKIKCGTCGTTQGCKTKTDGAFALPAAEEKRLVYRGVAEYVTKPIVGAVAEEINEAPIYPAYSVDMEANNLRSLLEQYGIPYKARMAKADMVAALDAYLGVDEAPECNIQEPVL